MSGAQYTIDDVITVTDWVVKILSDRDGATIADIADASGYSSGAVRSAVTHMRQLGLVEAFSFEESPYTNASASKVWRLTDNAKYYFALQDIVGNETPTYTTVEKRE